jgi:hypothetical protein
LDNKEANVVFLSDADAGKVAISYTFRPTQPLAGLDYEGEALTGLSNEAGYEYNTSSASYNGEWTTLSVSGGSGSITSIIPEAGNSPVTVYLRLKASPASTTAATPQGVNLPGAPQAISLPARPAAPVVYAHDATEEEGQGTLTGLLSGMEYRGLTPTSSSPNNWAPVTPGSMSVNQGSYEVRVAASNTGQSFSSAATPQL